MNTDSNDTHLLHFNIAAQLTNQLTLDATKQNQRRDHLRWNYSMTHIEITPKPENEFLFLQKMQRIAFFFNRGDFSFWFSFLEDDNESVVDATSD